MTSLDHETIGLDERMRRLLELLDGTRDREALARELGKERGIAENLELLAALALLEATDARMSDRPDITVRHAEIADADSVGQLLHDFNSEFDEPTPGPPALAARVRQLLAGGDTTVPRGAGPDGVAVFDSVSRSGPKRSSATWRSSTSSLLGAGRASGER